MKRQCRGHVVALGCVLMTAAFLLFTLKLRIGRFYVDLGRAETAAQMSVLASLRMRVEALARIAERWEDIGRQLGDVRAFETVFLPSAETAGITWKTQALSRALTGYQARAQSIVTVTAQANDVSRDRVVIESDRGARLNLQPRSAVVLNEHREAQTVPALWYQRGWQINDDIGDPDGTVVHRVRFAGRWPASVAARGALRWNRSLHGNGGYPRSWASAVADGRLRPHRTASYRAVLVDTP